MLDGMLHIAIYGCVCSVCVKETSASRSANKLCEKDDIICCMRRCTDREHYTKIYPLLAPLDKFI